MAHDQRDITLKPSTTSIEPTRTGPKTEQLRREQEEERAEEQSEDA